MANIIVFISSFSFSFLLIDFLKRRKEKKAEQKRKEFFIQSQIYHLETQMALANSMQRFSYIVKSNDQMQSKGAADKGNYGCGNCCGDGKILTFDLVWITRWATVSGGVWDMSNLEGRGYGQESNNDRNYWEEQKKFNELEEVLDED